MRHSLQGPRSGDLLPLAWSYLFVFYHLLVMASYEFMRINLDLGFNFVVTYFYNVYSALRSIPSITKMMWIEVASELEFCSLLFSMDQRIIYDSYNLRFE